MSTQSGTYENLKENFVKVCKRILKENLTQNRHKHIEYLHDLIESFNAAVDYLAKRYSRYDERQMQTAVNECKYFRGKVLNCYQKLNITESLPTDSHFALLSFGIISKYFTIAEIQSVNLGSIPFTSTTPALTPAASLDTLVELVHEQANINMAMSSVDFLALAARTINHNFNGNPLGLSAFINSIEMLKEIVPANLEAFFAKFILSRLEGKAMECVPEDAQHVDVIIASLRQHIKPDNSKVVAGRLLALRPDRAKLTDFTEQAELLADALQRSLIIEGITHSKAREMTIERTVELCRNSTRSDLVKSILAATKFDSPKEVVAKYVVEANTEEKEKQILQFKAQNKRGFNRGRGQYKNHKHNNGYQKNGQNNYNNNSNFRGHNKFRGRGRGRGNYNNNNYNRNSSQQYVRYTENLPGPSQDGRATQQQTNQQVYIPFQHPD